MLANIEIISEEDAVCESLIQGDRPPVGFYRKSKNRILVVRYLVEMCLEREGSDRLIPLKVEEFKKFNLYSLLTTYYNGSPRKALTEAYKEELLQNDIFANPQIILQNIIEQGVISEPPRGFWLSLENRQLTVHYLVFQVLNLNKDQIYQVTANDFIKNGLGGFLTHYYACSPIKALIEAFPDSQVFLFHRMDPVLWENEQIRSAAVTHFVSKVTPADGKITFKLLINLGMKHSLAKYYQGDIKKLLSDVKN